MTSLKRIITNSSLTRNQNTLMLLFSNARIKDVPVKIIVDFNPAAKFIGGDNVHTISAKVGDYILADKQEVRQEELIKQVELIQQKAHKVAMIISSPEQDEDIKWLRSHTFNFSDIELPER